MHFIELNIKREKSRVGKRKVKLLKYGSYSSEKANGESNRRNCQPGIDEKETDFSLQIELLLTLVAL